MPNITLSIPEETKRRMEKHPHVKWSSAIRAIIERRLDDFEETERLAQKSTLTERDVEKLAKKVNTAMGKRAKALLNGTNR